MEKGKRQIPIFQTFSKSHDGIFVDVLYIQVYEAVAEQ